MPATTLILIFLALAAVLAALLLLRMRRALALAEATAARSEGLAAARGRSLSLAAQELRGIAAGMGAWSGAGLGDPAEEPDTGIAAAAQQVLRLADELAQMAADPRRRTIHEAPAPLAPIVERAIGVVERQIRPATRHWRIDPALREPILKADRRALEGALAALLRRAASLSREGDAIALRWVLASETVAIVVEDEGDGTPAQDLVPEAVAERPGTRGLDIGLSLARSLAAAHGGDVRLEAAPGIGARAWLTLPRSRLLGL